jgi:hypothetical protein
MGKLHELLAVEADLEGAYKRIIEEALVTFTKKPDHFLGQDKILEMFDEDRKKENTTEHKEMVTTVPDKLNYVMEHVIRFYDALYQKELANTNAKADLIVDGETIATDLPATFLLGMENKLKFLRASYEGIPTLAPGIKWVLDEKLGKGVYVSANPNEVFKTAKVFKHQVLVPPTDKHPAQIEKWEEQVPVGKYTTTTSCSMLTPARKSELIGRIDSLIQACKKARQKANCTEVADVSIAKKMMDYINK